MSDPYPAGRPQQSQPRQSYGQQQPYGQYPSGQPQQNPPVQQNTDPRFNDPRYDPRAGACYSQPPYHKPRRVRRFGCLAQMFLGLLVLLFSCVIFFALYVAFPPPSINVLVLGVDARGNEGNVVRTDSIIIVGVQPSHLRVSALSVPRDVFIYTPDYGDQRINSINVLGEVESPGSGIPLLRSSIQSSFDIPVDRYIWLDFRAFRALVDSVGGVDIEVMRHIVDYQYPTEDYGTMQIEFQPGWQHMDGATALIYARTRHGDDDYRRAERQQQVLSAVASKLINPIYIPGAVIALTQNSRTDLNIIDIVQIAPSMLASLGNLERNVIDRDELVGREGYVIPNYQALAPWIQTYLGR